MIRNKHFHFKLACSLTLMAGAATLAFTQSRENQEACQQNLKQFSLGLLMYMQDYDEMLPPMKMPAQVHNRVHPYIKNRSVFSCPESRTYYLPNPALNYVNLVSIESPAEFVMLRDSQPHTREDGKKHWNVAYVDGHVRPLTTEPKLGKPAPTPRPLSPAQRRRAELERLKAAKKDIERQIRALEAEDRRARGR